MSNKNDQPPAYPGAPQAPAAAHYGQPSGFNGAYQQGPPMGYQPQPQYGQPQYGQPQYGQPPYGQQPPVGYYPQQPPQGYYNNNRGSGSDGCLSALLGAAACCCCLDFLF